ncbi:hypothetical protein SALBM311S_01827 [Streptomyces alboniger]
MTTVTRWPSTVIWLPALGSVLGSGHTYSLWIASVLLQGEASLLVGGDHAFRPLRLAAGHVAA